MERRHSYDEEIRLWRSLFVAMVRLLNQVEQDLKPTVDLTVVDLGILFSLKGTGAQPMGSLAALFSVDPSVITYRVRRLEGLRYVERKTSELDGRVVNVSLTRRGHGVLARARTAMLHAARDHFFTFVDPGTLGLLTAVFEDVVAERVWRDPSAPAQIEADPLSVHT